MLKRLQDTTSSYNVVEWEKERKHQEKQVHSICRFRPSIALTKSPRRHRNSIAHSFRRVNFAGRSTDADKVHDSYSQEEAK